MPQCFFSRRTGDKRGGRHACSVEAIEPRVMLAVFTVTTTDDAGPGSLRQAILDANTAAGTDEVRFDIPGDPAVVRTIAPVTELPAVVGPALVNGFSQPRGTISDWMVEISGAAAPAGSVGLRLGGQGVTVRGLRINRFPSDGMVIEGGGGHEVTGNFIGADPRGGPAAGGNGGSGVWISNSANNRLGVPEGVGPHFNIISGNARWGVEIRGTESRGNQLSWNYIGLGSQDAPLPNGMGGVQITDAPGNYVGGLGAGVYTNFISGNRGPGVHVQGIRAVGNLVGGNHIGLDESGDVAVGNTAEGVRIDNDASRTHVFGNDIAGNGAGGVVIAGPGAADNVLEWNTIGTNARAAWGGNGGTVPIGNGPGAPGVRIEGARTRVGGDSALAPIAYVQNLIAFNAGAGISMRGAGVGDPPLGNTVAGNQIHSNGGLGIDLRADGVTANDNLDADRGPNNQQNYPVLTSAERVLVPDGPIVVRPATRVRGSLHSTPNTTFRLRFYSSPALDPTGHGEGAAYRGWGDVTTNAAGDATFELVLLPSQLLETEPVPAGHRVTATATAPDGNTSEFSAGALVAGVAGRHAFYNRSGYDGGDPAATPADDNAIAPDVLAARPGGPLDNVNHTTYVRGLNGVMVDVVGRAAASAILPQDVSVRVSTTGQSWGAGPSPSQVAVRPGAGVGGADRVTLIWPDNAIKNTWAEITLAANERTGLAAPDVFIFGNLAGDNTGGSLREGRVDANDVANVKRLFGVYFNRPAPLEERADHNRDGRINAHDLAAVKANLTRTLAYAVASPFSASAGVFAAADESEDVLFAL